MKRLFAFAFFAHLYFAAALQAATAVGTNFVVYAQDPSFAQQVLNQAEQSRRDMSFLWLGEEIPSWSQKCPITVVVTEGAGGETSFVFSGGEVYGWQMKVRGPPQKILDSVVPHEVTHTIFASYFREPLPRWADEGACTTVEQEDTRRYMRSRLISDLRSNKSIPFGVMLSMKDYPDDPLTLYAQGASAVDFLLENGGHRHFVSFVDAGLASNNWDSALNQFYGHGSAMDFQNAWLDWVRKTHFRGNSAQPAQSGTVMLEFGAPWCGPCRDMEPTIDRLISEGYPIRKVNVDRERGLAQQFRINSIPTVVVISNGREVSRQSGVLSAQTLKSMLSRVGSTNTTATAQTAPVPEYTAFISVTEGNYTDHGTGALVYDDLILTCYHTFRDHPNGQVLVTFPNGYRSNAVKVEEDPQNDLAVLRINQPNISSASLNVQDAKPVGSVSVAGKLGVLRGVASVLQGWGTPQVGNAFEIRGRFPQNAAYSGGPVLDSARRIVGVFCGVDGNSGYGNGTAVFGRPVRNILNRALSRLGRNQPSGMTKVDPPNTRATTSQPSGSGVCTCGEDCTCGEERFSAIEARLDDFITRQQAMDYLQSNEFPVPETDNFVTKDVVEEVQQTVVTVQEQLGQNAEADSERHRSILGALEGLPEKAASAAKSTAISVAKEHIKEKVGWAGIKTLLMGLGISSPAALAIYLGLRVVASRIKKRGDDNDEDSGQEVRDPKPFRRRWRY